MNHYYEDLLSLSSKPPKWFDEHMVPRFCDFHPDRCANIYANEVVLVQIFCQNCGKAFAVCASRGGLEMWRDETGKFQPTPTLKDRVLKKTLFFGDPPNVRCCPSGPTMNSVENQVLEFWEEVDHEWERRSELEVSILDDMWAP